MACARSGSYDAGGAGSSCGLETRLERIRWAVETGKVRGLNSGS